MPTNRSYEDACAIARALDVVGERWALLVVRELLLGPQRYSDLRRSLPKVSSNLMADRLRELEERGVVTRRTLPPPAGSRVYELTEWGRELEPVLLALGDWGMPAPQQPSASLSPTSILLYLRSCAQPDPDAPEATINIELDSCCWTLRVSRGHIEIAAGDETDADVTLRTDPQSLKTFIGNSAELHVATLNGKAEVSGSLAILVDFLSHLEPSDT